MLAFVCAYSDGELVGFVKLAWDGSVHAFLLEPTVSPRMRHRGIGRMLVARATEVAQARRLEWLHVDYEPELSPFYRACGFEPTPAGLIRLDRWPPASVVASAPAVPTTRAVVVFPDGGLAPLEEFRRRWDPLAERVGAHVTLMFPILDEISDDDLIAHVVSCVRGMQPFDILVQDITGTSEQYLFANVKQGNDPLIALHDRLYSGPLQRHLVRSQTFLPHVTVGRVVDREDFEAALAEAADARFSIRTRVTTLAVSKLEPTGPLRIIASVALDS